MYHGLKISFLSFSPGPEWLPPTPSALPYCLPVNTLASSVAWDVAYHATCWLVAVLHCKQGQWSTQPRHRPTTVCTNGQWEREDWVNLFSSSFFFKYFLYFIYVDPKTCWSLPQTHLGTARHKVQKGVIYGSFSICYTFIHVVFLETNIRNDLLSSNIMWNDIITWEEVQRSAQKEDRRQQKKDSNSNNFRFPFYFPSSKLCSLHTNKSNAQVWSTLHWKSGTHCYQDSLDNCQLCCSWGEQILC